MSLMTWTVEQYGTNISCADTEHQRVFHNLNILYDLRIEGAGEPDLTEQLDILLAIVADHFAHEETEMRAKNFIGYESHKIEHDELINTCTEMDIKVHEGELALTERICQLIKSWFENHIPEYDRAYAEALNG